MIKEEPIQHQATHKKGHAQNDSHFLLAQIVEQANEGEWHEEFHLDGEDGHVFQAADHVFRLEGNQVVDHKNRSPPVFFTLIEQVILLKPCKAIAIDERQDSLANEHYEGNGWDQPNQFEQNYKANFLDVSFHWHFLTKGLVRGGATAVALSFLAVVGQELFVEEFFKLLVLWFCLSLAILLIHGSEEFEHFVCLYK